MHSSLKVIFGLTFFFTSVQAEELSSASAGLNSGSDSQNQITPTSNGVSTDSSNPDSSAQQSTGADQNLTPSTPQLSYCPAPETLQKDVLTWEAPGGWSSDTNSFIKNIKAFTGAHWVGVQFGKILCSYSGVEPGNFPLMLQKTQYVKEPITSGWSNNVDGVRNCLQEDVNNCPFEVIDLYQTPGNIYQQLENFKK